MKSYRCHRGVEVFGRAATDEGLPVSFVSFQDHETGRFLRLPISLRNLLNPVLLRRSIVRCPPEHLIIVREFLTLPLLLASPLLWGLRRRILFVSHHNLQRAYQRTRDRLAFRLLLGLGFRFILLETEAGLETITKKPGSEQILVLPLGIGEEEPPAVPPPAGPVPVVGVVGHFRGEKGQQGILRLLDRVTRSGGLEIEVLVGSSSEDFLREAGSHGFRTLDTTTDAAYAEALALCDVLLLNYDRDSYYYRPSATITDAIAFGRNVVCPDYPIFRAQVGVPVPAGATFTSETDLPRAIGEALRARTEFPDAAQRYRDHRSPKSIARLLKAYLNREAGR